jgi:hypothetical protein
VSGLADKLTVIQTVSYPSIAQGHRGASRQTIVRRRSGNTAR